MKKLFILLAMIGLLASCNQNEGGITKTYTDISVDQINSLKSPVILIAKEKSFGIYSITVKDSSSKILVIGNMSALATTIGESRNVGDTIR